MQQSTPMKGGRGGRRARSGAPTDLLVCFPSSSRLALTPKAITYSPSRHMDPAPPSRRLLSRFQGGIRISPPSGTSQPPQPSSSSWSHMSKGKNKSKVIAPSLSPKPSEPTSPTVTCAGQVKVRHGSTSVHVGNAGRNRRRKRRTQQWLEAIGIKRDVMNFLGALRGRLRFSFACFQAPLDCSTDDDDSDDGDEEDLEDDVEGNNSGVFKRFSMPLEEKNRRLGQEKVEEEEINGAPPANALILMRCRSAPARGWEERRKKKEEEEEEEEERTMVMGYEVVKETWLVDGSSYGSGSNGGNCLLARSRSYRR